MADLAVTAANVVAGTNSTKELGIAAETITAGQTVYRDVRTGKWRLADSATAGSAEVVGIALASASLDQPLQILLDGDLDIGATIVVGETYVLSETAGGIQPVTVDLGAGEYVTVIGHGERADNLQVSLVISGAAHA